MSNLPAHPAASKPRVGQHVAEPLGEIHHSLHQSALYSVEDVAERLGLKKKGRLWSGPNPLNLGADKSGFLLYRDGGAWDRQLEESYSHLQVAQIAGIPVSQYEPWVTGQSANHPRRARSAGSTTHAQRTRNPGHSTGRSNTMARSRSQTQRTSYFRYEDAQGELLFEVVRFDNLDGSKRFLQRRPHPSGGWVWSLGSGWSERDGENWRLLEDAHDPTTKPHVNAEWVDEVMERPLYKRHEVARASTIIVVEGEKCAEAAKATLEANDVQDVVATTNPHGAGHWRPEHSDLLVDKQVWVLPDNDGKGHRHAHDVCQSLLGKASSIKLVTLPGLAEKGDVANWLEAGGTFDQLQRLVEEAPLWQPESEAQSALDLRDSSEPDDARPTIVLGKRDLRRIAEEAWAALAAHRDAARMFNYQGQMVRLAVDENSRPQIETLRENRLLYQLTNAARFVAVNKDGDYVPRQPPTALIQYLLGTPGHSTGMRLLRGIVTAPIVAANGTVETEPGYLAASQLYYHEPQGHLDLPDTSPTKSAVRSALALFRDELLADFPFADEASFAHTLALILLPYIRLLIDGPTPLHLVNAPTPATGKSLLVSTAISCFAPEAALPTALPQAEAEMEKRITTFLLQGPSHVWFDNVKENVDSASLEAVLTGTRWTGRLLGSSEQVRQSPRCVWVATSDNATMSEDMASRTVSILLDTQMERPSERRNFRLPSPPTWVSANRARVVASCLTLIRAWLEAGRPAYAGSGHTRYQAWGRVMGGILDVVGVPGFLSNVSHVQVRLNPEDEAWGQFISLWWETFGSLAVTVGGQLAPLAFGTDGSGGPLSVYVHGVGHGLNGSLGKQLRAREGRNFGGKILRQTRNGARCSLFQLTPVDLERGGVGGVGGVATPETTRRDSAEGTGRGTASSALGITHSPNSSDSSPFHNEEVWRP